MFRITRLTDYGVMLMTELAQAEESVLNAAALAARSHLPAPSVSKILQLLLREGLLTSVRGAGGGYHLTRPATDISIRDIIVALEGPIAITECSLDHARCDQQEHCNTRGNWNLINQVVRGTLGDISLADMTRPGFTPVLRLEKRYADNRIPVTQA
ncbi:MAG: SUF system Fe-S cluster assembly regulator [Mariprofundaceae bacterium]|nr:SUF system Fe-S cluster assembly regulator [Mariprofundaceae bacterium]